MPLWKSKKNKKVPISDPTVLKNGNRVNEGRLSPLRLAQQQQPTGSRNQSPVPPPKSPGITTSIVSQKKEIFEEMARKPSTLSSPSSSRPSSQVSLTESSGTLSRYERSPYHGSRQQNTSEASLTFSFDEDLTSVPDKVYKGVKLELPPLKPSVKGGVRKVLLSRKPQGGFGIKLSLSSIPDPTAPSYSRMGFLIEPRSDPSGEGVPLVTGDVLLTVNGKAVEGLKYENVVEIIKSSGSVVEIEVACLPELTELSERGALDIIEVPEPAQAGSVSTASIKGRGKTQGTLRRARSKRQKQEFKARTVAEVQKEKANVESNRMWLLHKGGYSAVNIVKLMQYNRSNLAMQTNLVRHQGRDTKRVKLENSDEILEVAEEDLEKANPPSMDQIEDVTDLIHLNETSVIHVLRQRYASSLIHTYAGRHMIIINPIRPLASYSDKVLDMFYGGRREDMPPHIFAVAQQAYTSLLTDHADQAIVLLGPSGAGKTFNARYLLRYLATVGSHGVNTHAILEKFQAAFILLRSFGSAATYLNPESTRFHGMYTMEFDAVGNLQGATVKTYLLEKVRVAQRQVGEGVFSIYPNLLVGADSKLKSDLQLDIPVADATNAYITLEHFEDKKQRDSAAKVWAVLKNCISVLNITADEEKALWSLLAAIYHLGFAGVKKAEKTLTRAGNRFMSPAASQRAAAVLGISHEDLAHYIFSPPRGASMRISGIFGPGSPGGSDGTPSPSPSASSLTTSPFLGRSSGWDSLSSFCMGLYEQAFNALVLLINRSLQTAPSSNTSKKFKISILDPPGFQDITLSEQRKTATFDELCDNYAMERLQMLFHDSTFTAEQDRYIQEEIYCHIPDVALSPLPVIDVIDRSIPMRRGGEVDVSTDKRGLLWILDEESIFPGATDQSFLERLQIYHGGTLEDHHSSDNLVTIDKEKAQFTIRHCHKSLPIAYDVSGWVRQARDHPSYRVVPQALTESKRNYIASVFQGRGVAAATTSLSASSLKHDSRRQSLQKLGSLSAVVSSTGVKKSSVCLQTKYQLDYIIGELRNPNQWFVHCILPHKPHKLPHALGGGEIDRASVYGRLDVSLVSGQLKRSDIVKAARLYKQGYPEHMTLTAFRRRYESIIPVQSRPSGVPDKEAVEKIVEKLEVKSASHRIGLSLIFFRAGTVNSLEQLLENKTSDVIALFQTRCRGYLGRKQRDQLEMAHNAVRIIQSNIRAYLALRDSRWWRIINQLKPVMAVRKTEEERQELESQMDTLRKKFEVVENERDHLRENEHVLEEKLASVTARLDEEIMTSSNTNMMLEQEQLNNRERKERLDELQLQVQQLTKENEDLRVELAQINILHRIHQSETGEDALDDTEENSMLLEKYRRAQREIESLKMRVSSEHEEEIDGLLNAKRNLDKKILEQEGEIDDLRRTLNQLRKKLTKQASEMNDLQLVLENQQSRNEDLEKKQRKFDVELSAAKEEATKEKEERATIQREKDSLQSEMLEKDGEIKRVNSELQKLKSEKEELEAEYDNLTSKSASESEMASLKSLKRELQSKIEELEDELDDANVRMETLEQAKSRSELSHQTTKNNLQKELDAREEELEKMRSTMNKRVRSLETQLEEEHSEKQSALKDKQHLEIQLSELQGSMLDAAEEHKLKKTIKKQKALIRDLQQEVEFTRESGRQSSTMRALKHKLEEKEDVENSLNKTIKKLQNELSEMLELGEETERKKVELESKVSELSRQRNELELRMEEDQDEVEDLMQKQRQQANQINQLERQLMEANMQVAELEDGKEKLEHVVSDLRSQISELQSQGPKMGSEVAELRIKELQQKLDLEATTKRRLEHQVQRLKSQLEKASQDRGGSSEADSEMIKKYQRQLKEMREELKLTESKEQDQSRKRRNAEGQVEELEAILKATKSELRSANDRIKSLQRSLAGEGEDESDNYSSDDDDDKEDYDGIGSETGDSDGSYQIGQYATTDDDFDDDDDQDQSAVSEFLEARRKTKEAINELMNDSVDSIPVGRSRKRVDELLESDDSPQVNSKSSPKASKRDHHNSEDVTDSPLLSRRTKTILEDGSDVEEVPEIKPRKTLEELLKSDSDSEHEDL
jgi:myosin-18